jgi:hypothetical protein
LYKVKGNMREGKIVERKDGGDGKEAGNETKNLNG